MKRVPTKCPSCNQEMRVCRLRCRSCETEVNGEYPLPLLLQLTPEEQDFVIQFVKSSGSLKEMSKHMTLSYPTVRNYLDNLISKLNNYDNPTNQKELSE